MEVVITPDEPGLYDDWFPNPLDSMPIATENPRPEEEIADWFDESDDIEATKTLHQEMYEFATKNGTTITMGGSENVMS